MRTDIDYRPAVLGRRRDGRAPVEVKTDAEIEQWKSIGDHLDERDAAARAANPPGKTLYVQTRALTRRRRAGIEFTNKDRVQVDVVDLSSSDVAVMLSSGKMVVNPSSAVSVIEDDALMVFESPMTNSDAPRVAELEAQLAATNAELALVNAQLSGLREARRKQDPDAVASDRMTKK